MTGVGTAVWASARRVVLLALNQEREIRREPLFLAWLGLAVVAVAGGWWWRDFRFGTEESRFLLQFGHAVQGLLVNGLALVLTAQAFTRAQQAGTAAVWWAGPVSRGEFVVGTMAGVGVVLAAYGVASSAVLVGLLELGPGGAPGGWPSEGGHLGGLLLRGSVVVAMTAWFASYGRSVGFVVMAAGALVGLGQLRGLIEGDERWVSALVRVVPDWEQLGGEALGGFAVIYGLGYVLGYSALAVVGYHFRED